MAVAHNLNEITCILLCVHEATCTSMAAIK